MACFRRPLIASTLVAALSVGIWLCYSADLQVCDPVQLDHQLSNQDFVAAELVSSSSDNCSSVIRSHESEIRARFCAARLVSEETSAMAKLLQHAGVAYEDTYDLETFCHSPTNPAIGCVSRALLADQGSFVRSSTSAFQSSYQHDLSRDKREWGATAACFCALPADVSSTLPISTIMNVILARDLGCMWKPKFGVTVCDMLSVRIRQMCVALPEEDRRELQARGVTECKPLANFVEDAQRALRRTAAGFVANVEHGRQFFETVIRPAVHRVYTWLQEHWPSVKSLLLRAYTNVTLRVVLGAFVTVTVSVLTLWGLFLALKSLCLRWRMRRFERIRTVADRNSARMDRDVLDTLLQSFSGLHSYEATCIHGIQITQVEAGEPLRLRNGASTRHWYEVLDVHTDTSRGYIHSSNLSRLETGLIKAISAQRGAKVKALDKVRVIMPKLDEYVSFMNTNCVNCKLPSKHTVLLPWALVADPVTPDRAARIRNLQREIICWQAAYLQHCLRYLATCQAGHAQDAVFPIARVFAELFSETLENVYKHAGVMMPEQLSWWRTSARCVCDMQMFDQATIALLLQSYHDMNVISAKQLADICAGHLSYATNVADGIVRPIISILSQRTLLFDPLVTYLNYSKDNDENLIQINNSLNVMYELVKFLLKKLHRGTSAWVTDMTTAMQKWAEHRKTLDHRFLDRTVGPKVVGARSGRYV
eukprot:TRINITY_DN2695_c0_g1_i2.p1 TRINITY_DN2695_c0_g1~~TRINITY_DN2695_c0_g1_i2.p1  ORF type:complete len:708 (-),score=112.99 TRINITY_DN2695_c0_g1_i2:675-2798(-)